MDYSKLVTRRRYEEVAKGLGYRNLLDLSFADLERIAGEFQAEQKALYQASKPQHANTFNSTPEYAVAKKERARVRASRNEAVCNILRRSKSTPASWVLADTPGTPKGLACALEVPEFEAVPDHVQEMEPGTEWVTCPACDGEKHLLSLGAAYEYAQERLTRCLRCHGDGEVLDYVGVQPIEEAYPAHIHLKEAA